MDITDKVYEAAYSQAKGWWLFDSSHKASAVLFKMRSSSVFLAFVVMISAMNGFKCSLMNASKNQTPLCNCHCNVNQVPQDCNKVMKALEAKIEHLIALVNKTSILSPSPEPTKPPGKIIYIYSFFLS